MKFFFAGILIALLGVASVHAQDKVFTKTGTITFDASASLEKVYAVTKKATCVLNTSTGQIEFAVLMKAFSFEKALMEEHFNENYVESDTYPKGTFKGKIDNLSEVNFAVDGTYPVNISGDLTMHGVTKSIKSKGTFTVKDGVITGLSEFKIYLNDFDISIPSVVKESISNEVTITVNVDLMPLVQ